MLWMLAILGAVYVLGVPVALAIRAMRSLTYPFPKVSNWTLLAKSMAWPVAWWWK